jgi:hypothetical protein
MIKTPREFHCPAQNIHSLDSTNVTPPFGQMLAQISAPADSSFPPRKCFFCGKTECTLTTCPAALVAKTDPFTRCTLVKYFGIRALDVDPDPAVDNVGEDPSNPGDRAAPGGDLLDLDPNSGGAAAEASFHQARQPLIIPILTKSRHQMIMGQ